MAPTGSRTRGAGRDQGWVQAGLPQQRSKKASWQHPRKVKWVRTNFVAGGAQGHRSSSIGEVQHPQNPSAQELRGRWGCQVLMAGSLILPWCWGAVGNYGADF